MILIGLTGTIGSGKTFALNFFKSKKITVFSADEEVKKILNIKEEKKQPEVIDIIDLKKWRAEYCKRM